MTIKNFKIGPLKIRISYPDELTPPDNFLLFETQNEDFDYEYNIEISDKLPAPEGELIAEREDLRIYRNNESEIRLLGARGREGFYGAYREIDDRHTTIVLDRAYADLFSMDTVFSSLFALERRILSYDALILHCAYLNHNENAILFSAPSGVGKSTQAGLWEKYKGAKTENGDRSLLTLEDGKWFANGWPVCGSSEICNNTKHPVSAIVTLSQATENSVSTLSGMQGFSRLYSEVTTNSWDRSAAVKNMDLLENLVQNVPVYHLACDISENAVDILFNTIDP